MGTIQQIKKVQEDRLSKIFKDLGIFFAFSQEQFDEQKKEDVIYVSAGCGMIIPKDNIETYKKRFDDHTKLCKVEKREGIPLDDYIKYELYNYECFYTGNYNEAFDHVQHYYPECTIEDVKRVYFQELPNTDN